MKKPEPERTQRDQEFFDIALLICMHAVIIAPNRVEAKTKDLATLAAIGARDLLEERQKFL